ncbi:unnamed protein product [Staurois parvus]|uniref:Uncharacterized protein n=1 Tax=Staurois parvus TaxID=386267 RepID=A0ABN9B4Z4_9NEOB|nr:unnamed protein product [Staurois parvus]
MGDTERQLRWALICGTDVTLKSGTDGHWQVAWMSTALAVMETNRWHCWGYTDHQGILIMCALMELSA